MVAGERQDSSQHEEVWQTCRTPPQRTRVSTVQQDEVQKKHNKYFINTPILKCASHPTTFYSSNPVQQVHWGTRAYMFTWTLISTGLYQHVTNQGYRWTQWTLCVRRHTVCTCVCVCLWPSVGLVGGEQRSVHRLHAGRAGERPHQPVIYTVHVVDVHAGQEPDRVSVNKVHHTNDASAQENTDMADLKFTV